MTWYIDSGPGLVHKFRGCASGTGQNSGGKTPYYWTVEADSSPGWRHCHCVRAIDSAVLDVMDVEELP